MPTGREWTPYPACDERTNSLAVTQRYAQATKGKRAGCNGLPLLLQRRSTGSVGGDPWKNPPPHAGTSSQLTQSLVPICTRVFCAEPTVGFAVEGSIPMRSRKCNREKLQELEQEHQIRMGQSYFRGFFEASLSLASHRNPRAVWNTEKKSKAPPSGTRRMPRPGSPSCK